MSDPSGREMGRRLLDAVRGYVARALAPVLTRVKALEDVTIVQKGASGERGEPGLAGRDGKDGLPGERGEKGDHGKEGSPGRDGKDGRDGREGKDGEPGRDALAIEVQPAIDKTKSYARGSFAEHRGGLVRALRNTDPLSGELSAAGWSVVVNGIAEEQEELRDDGRTIVRTTVYTDGRKLAREIKTNAILYREVWREGEYERGDVVTWGGSAWHCQRKTTDKPGTSDAWKLMVKEGRPGKDAVTGAPSAKKPVNL